MRTQLKEWLKAYWLVVAMAAVVAAMSFSPENIGLLLAGLVLIVALLFVVWQEVHGRNATSLAGLLKSIWHDRPLTPEELEKEDRKRDEVVVSFRNLGQTIAPIGMWSLLLVIISAWPDSHQSHFSIVFKGIVLGLLWCVYREIRGLTRFIAGVVESLADTQQRPDSPTTCVPGQK